MNSARVFISYSHEPQAHAERVWEFASALKVKGVHVELDKFAGRPPEGWQEWCKTRLKPENADFVLMMCTPTYCDRVEKKVDVQVGRGAYFEGKLINAYIYNEKENSRFLPVLLDDEPPNCIPIDWTPYHRYHVKAFDFGDRGFDELYRELTGQREFVPPETGAIVERPPRVFGASQPKAPPPVDLARIDRYAPAELIGREAETATLEAAWGAAAESKAHPHVLTFVALGGEGKTSLIAKWAFGRAAGGYDDCAAAFAWSFYSQGTRDQAGASSDLFLGQAIKFFGGEERPGESPHDKGKRLAYLVGAKRALLILDGLEPLQYAPTSPLAGHLKDDGLKGLLKGLAQRNAGLCLVTTRYRIADLEGWSATAPQRDLAPLSDAAGGRLLAALGVKGTAQEREELSSDVRGHALTLNLIGTYISGPMRGDIRKADLIRFDKVDPKVLNGHAFRALDAYVRWFESDDNEGPRALAVLRSLGLFDRPADARCLEALWRAPVIDGLTEPLTGLDGEARNAALTALEEAKLVTVVSDASGALVSLDAHPLTREYFGTRLRDERPQSAEAAHRRLYEHLTTTTQDKAAPTLDDLQPLFEAVAHGCAAGMPQQAFDEAYWQRIHRGDEFYCTKKLGAYGADLGAVAGFFDAPWRRVSPRLIPAAQAWLLNEAAFDLRALGRLAEAREPMRAGLEMRVAQQVWQAAAIAAGNLSELELALGEIGAAVADGETAVARADRSEDLSRRLASRTAHADALHQAGRRAEAEALFVAAEAMQAEFQPTQPRLYSLWGFRYCDLRLGGAERAAWRRRFASGAPGADATPNDESLFDACREATDRADYAIAIARRNNWLLEIGLDALTLARAALYAAMLRGETPPADDAVAALRCAGSQHHLPRALLTRALQRAVAGDFEASRDDLDEALEIAERGPMRLYLADIHLHRARIFGLFRGRPPAYPWTSAEADLAEARRLIDACGYGRRLDELKDAEAAWTALG